MGPSPEERGRVVPLGPGKCVWGFYLRNTRTSPFLSTRILCFIATDESEVKTPDCCVLLGSDSTGVMVTFRTAEHGGVCAKRLCLLQQGRGSVGPEMVLVTRS